MNELPKLEDFPAHNYDQLRYGDTDRQGHVNNAVFSTMYETGRMVVLDRARACNLPEGTSFVIARITIDFRAELFWPGQVDIGTAVKSIGNSSITLAQALYQAGKCVSTAESVMVQLGADHRAAPLGPELRAFMEKLKVK